MRAEEGDDFLDLVAEAVEALNAFGPDVADVGSAFAVLEEVEAFGAEPVAECLRGAQREPPLTDPGDAHRFAQPGPRLLAAGNAVDLKFGRAGDKLGKVRLGNMFFEFLARSERFRLGALEAGELGDAASRLEPLFDGVGVLAGLDAGLELVELHVAEPTLVETDNGGLVLVVVWWTEDFAGDAAAIDASEVAFWRVARLLFLPAKLVGVLAENVAQCFVLALEDCLVSDGEEQRGTRAVGAGLEGELDEVAFGFVKDELGDVEERVGAGRMFHRLDHRGEALFFGQETDLDGRWRRRTALDGRSRSAFHWARPFAARQAATFTTWGTITLRSRRTAVAVASIAAVRCLAGVVLVGFR